MTLATLKDRVLFWQEALRLMGVSHWTIHVDVVDEPSDSALYNAKAAVSCSTHYDQAWLEIGKDWLRKTSDDEADEVIIHELVHVTMRDMDDTIVRVCEYLGEPAKSIWLDEVRHEREGLVDRVALTLHSLSKQNVVQ